MNAHLGADLAMGQAPPAPPDGLIQSGEARQWQSEADAADRQSISQLM
jgi:hypothetical protein